MDKKGLLSATFEQSKKVVSKKILTENGAQIGLMSSMSLLKRIGALLVGLFLIGNFYAVGVGLPRFITLEPGETIMLSESTIYLINLIGDYTTGITEGLLMLLLTLITLNLLPKLNYSHQLAFANLTLIIFVLSSTTAFTPFIIGLTVDAFGWIGFALQVLVCVYLWKSWVLSSVDQLKKQLYNGATTSKDWGDGLMVFIKKYGGILLLLSIINRWTFNFGEITTGRPHIFSFLYGWTFILVATITIFTICITLKNVVAAFYFFKYRKEYHQFFKISNEQWYGKWRGKKMDKKQRRNKL